MATVARPQEFLARFDKATSKLKTDLNLVEASNWIAAKTACDNNNAPDKVQYLAMLENSLGKRKINLFNKLELICTDEIKYLIENYGSVDTVFPVISQYRNVIKNTDSNHIALAFLKMPKSEYSDRRIKYSTGVKKDTAYKRPYYNDTGMIATAKDLLKSDSYINVAMGLCLLTGRRPSEVLLTAQFKAVEGLNDVVVFSGQLKTKESELSRDNYLIPVLAPAKDVINGLAKLRNMRDFSNLETDIGKTLAQKINSKTAKSQNEAVVRYFSDYLPNWENSEGKTEKVKPYNLRQVYLDIFWRWVKSGKFSAQDTIAINSFYVELLDSDSFYLVSSNLTEKNKPKKGYMTNNIATGLKIHTKNPDSLLAVCFDNDRLNSAIESIRHKSPQTNIAMYSSNSDIDKTTTYNASYPDDKEMICSLILGHTKNDLATVHSYMRVKYQGNG